MAACAMQPVVHIEKRPSGHLLAQVVSQPVNTEFLPLDQMPNWVLNMARDARVDGSRLVDSEALLDLAGGRLCSKREAYLLNTLRIVGAIQKSDNSIPPELALTGDSDILQGCSALLALRDDHTPRPGSVSKVRLLPRRLTWAL